jgi:hypothetical protein
LISKKQIPIFQLQTPLLCLSTHEAWVRGGGQTAIERVRDKLGTITKTHRPKPLPAEVGAAITGLAAD